MTAPSVAFTLLFTILSVTDFVACAKHNVVKDAHPELRDSFIESSAALELLEQGGNDDGSGASFHQHHEASHRGLQGSVANPFCSTGGSTVFYFDIEIKYTPQGGFDTSGCSTSDKHALAAHTNAILLDHGAGESGAGDDAVYLVNVCPDPSLGSRRTRRLGEAQHRELLWFVFSFHGGGRCRFCPKDDRDWRMLAETEQDQGASADETQRDLQGATWFEDTYVPEMQNTLRNALTNMVTDHRTSHYSCLGSGPRVDVTVTQVATASDYEQC